MLAISAAIEIEVQRVVDIAAVHNTPSNQNVALLCKQKLAEFKRFFQLLPVILSVLKLSRSMAVLGEGNGENGGNNNNNNDSSSPPDNNHNNDSQPSNDSAQADTQNDNTNINSSAPHDSMPADTLVTSIGHHDAILHSSFSSLDSFANTHHSSVSSYSEYSESSEDDSTSSPQRSASIDHQVIAPLVEGDTAALTLPSLGDHCVLMLRSKFAADPIRWSYDYPIKNRKLATLSQKLRDRLDICPITQADYYRLGQFADPAARTSCPYCGIGFALHPRRSNACSRLRAECVRITNSPSSRTYLCDRCGVPLSKHAIGDNSVAHQTRRSRAALEPPALDFQFPFITHIYTGKVIVNDSFRTPARSFNRHRHDASATLQLSVLPHISAMRAPIAAPAATDHRDLAWQRLRAAAESIPAHHHYSNPDLIKAVSSLSTQMPVVEEVCMHYPINVSIAQLC